MVVSFVGNYNIAGGGFYTGKARDPFSDNQEFRLKEANIQLMGDLFTHSIGLQRITFGETFGFNIVDIANPFDYRDFLFKDPIDRRIETWSLVSSAELPWGTADIIFTPKSQNPIWPKTYGDLKISTENKTTSEYGFRLNKTFDSGLDISIFTYRHQNRLPSFLAQTSFSGVTLKPMAYDVTSMGVFGSQSIGEGLVLRWEMIHMNKIHEPFLTITDGERYSAKKADLQAMVVGADYALTDLNLGLQLHTTNHDEDSWQTDKTPRWFSSLITWQISSNLSTELFYYQGIGNRDQQQQVRLIYGLNDNLVVGIDHIKVRAKDNGFLQLYNGHQSIGFDLELTF